MHVGVLGPLTVRLDGHEVALRGQRLRDVFVVLLQRRGRPVPAEVLLDLVWGDRSATLTVAAVHTVVSRLRRQLGARVITSTDSGYLIDRHVATDEDSFVDAVGEARRLLGGGDPDGAATCFRAALRCWRGDEAFQDVRTDLVDTDRARLAEGRAVAVEELAGLLLDHPAVGEPAEAHALCAGLIAQQPLRERPYQLAMMAAHRSDRQGDVVAIYHSLRRRLRDELGIGPSAASAELYLTIVRQDLPPAVATSSPARSRPTTAPIGLPAPVSPLIGRQAELDRLLDWLAAGRRLITLVGPGGVGKSRLLIELGARFSGPTEILYSELSGLTESEPDRLAEKIVVGLGFPLSQQGPVDSLIGALAGRDVLLLIDEAEWVIDAFAVVARTVLDRCPGLQIVVTSRLPTDLPGEALVLVEPLTVPADGARPDDIRSAPAVQFLAQRLADRAMVVEPDAASTTLLAAITRRVDGLPLALELTAGQSAGRSLAELATLVQAPLDLPATQRTRHRRHRTLRDTLEWSINRLDPDRQQVLRRLAVFAGRFDLPAAVAIAGPADADTAAVVRSLVRDALVHVDRTSSSSLHFRLLRTVRELALEGFDPVELAATHALHRRWHADRWRSAGEELILDVRSHLDDYLEALRSALAAGDADALADLTVTLTEFWRFTGGQDTGLQWVGIVLDSGVLRPDDRARVLVQRAALALHHDPALVLAATAAAIPLLESTGYTAGTVSAVSIRALELLAQDRLAEATAHADRAVQIARGREAEELANALGAQAVIYAVLERPELATVAIDEAMALVEQGMSSLEGVEAVSGVALALVNLERFDDAVRLLDGVDIPPAASPPPARFRLTLGWACVGCHDYPRALACFLQALPTPGDRQDARGVADRHAAETVLGAACALAALGHPYAPAALAGALELLPRVAYRSPPALQRAIARARAQVAHQPWPELSEVPTADLLAGLEQDLLDLGSAHGRSAAG